MTNIKQNKLQEIFKNTNLQLIIIQKLQNQYWKKYMSNELMISFKNLLKYSYNIIQKLIQLHIFLYDIDLVKVKIIPNHSPIKRTQNILNNKYENLYWNIIEVHNNKIITPLFILYLVNENDIEINYQNNSEINDFNKYLNLDGYPNFKYQNNKSIILKHKIETFYSIPNNIIIQEFNKINIY